MKNLTFLREGGDFLFEFLLVNIESHNRITPTWNSLPNNVVESISIWQFRLLLKFIDLNVCCIIVNVYVHEVHSVGLTEAIDS